jgi:hypothetical protein
MAFNAPVDNWEEVTSSNIKAVGTKGHYLIVEFNDGSVYRYPELAIEFPNLTGADSVGRYFHANIRHEPNEKLPHGEWPEA